MKIAFLITDITSKGGTERTTTLLANKLASEGHKVTIYSLFREGERPTFDLSPDIIVIYITDLDYSARYFKIKRLGRLIRSMQSLHGFKHEFNAEQNIIISVCFLPSLFLWLCGLAKKSVACEHYKYGMYNRLVRSIRNKIYKQFNKVSVLTDKDAKQFYKHGVQTVIIPNMVSFKITDKIHKRNYKRMISVGRLHPQKGYDLLIPALVPVFHKHPDWKIDIYGEGDDRKTLEDMTKQYGLMDFINFKGYSSDIHREYETSDFYVMSSRYEGLPMVLLESMACGCPAISFDCPEGPSELLSEGAGYLVENGNTDALSVAINRLIENENLRETYSLKGIERASNFTPDIIYGKWQSLIFNDINHE